MKNKLTLILIALIVFVQCKKEEDEGMMPPVLTCENKSCEASLQKKGPEIVSKKSGPIFSKQNLSE